MLRLALGKCKSLCIEKARGIEKALVTCDKNKVASTGTILDSNRVIKNEVTDEKGRIISVIVLK